MGIKSVVDENIGKASGGLSDAMCSACEMAVVWMQNQIKQNQTHEQILNYVNQVKTNLLFVFFLSFMFSLPLLSCSFVHDSICSSHFSTLMPFAYKMPAMRTTA